MSGVIWLVVAFWVGVAWGVWISAPCRTRLPRRRRGMGLEVEVGPSHDPRQNLQHMYSARLVDRKGETVHFERVDLREDGWEERLTEAVARMKQKRASLEAASRIAREP